MSDKQYNGWTNYETWRVNLEIFDDYFASLDEAELIDLKRESEYDLVQQLRDMVTERLDLDGPSGGLTRDYADAFIDGVNFYEIVRTQLADVVVPVDEEADDE